MTLKALYLQSGAYNALDDRMLAGMLLDVAADPLSGVGRIVTGLLTSAQGTPNMTVSVSPGRAIVPTPASDGGGYAVMNDASLNVTVTPVSTLPRVDLILMAVDDADYSGSIYGPKIYCLAGTPAASPVAPAQPAGTLLLATLNLLANATSVVNSAITRNLWSVSEAEYYASTIQSLAPGGDRPLMFPVVGSATPLVTKGIATGGATADARFTINRDGVWTVEAGYRMNGQQDGKSAGIWLGLDGTAAFRFCGSFTTNAILANANTGTPEAGGPNGPTMEYSISCTRRFGTGTSFNVYGWHNSNSARNSEPLGQTNHIRLVWLRP
jgi:hypothetical protein